MFVCVVTNICQRKNKPLPSAVYTVVVSSPEAQQKLIQALLYALPA